MQFEYLGYYNVSRVDIEVCLREIYEQIYVLSSEWGHRTWVVVLKYYNISFEKIRHFDNYWDNIIFNNIKIIL